jgi:Predicted nucleic acid-binding protein, contains PIN domain
MSKVVISDTSCFIILSKINEIELLHKVYENILTTPEIVAEYGEALPEWIEIVPVQDKYKQQLFEMQLGKGESSAMALSLEIPDSILIIDDYKARKTAEILNLKFIGTIGLIIKAKLDGIIPSVKPLLQKIKSTNFRLSTDLEQYALKEAREL